MNNKHLAVTTGVILAAPVVACVGLQYLTTWATNLVEQKALNHAAVIEAQGRAAIAYANANVINQAALALEADRNMAAVLVVVLMIAVLVLLVAVVVGAVVIVDTRRQMRELQCSKQ